MVKTIEKFYPPNALHEQPPSFIRRLGQDLVLRVLGRLLFSFYSPLRH